MVISIKKGKKRWIKVIGPVEFNNILLGESYVIDPNNLLGKKIQLNLSNLIGDMKRQNIVVGFKIKEIKGNDAYAELISYGMLQTHIRRLVRTGQDKIEDSFVVETKDNIKIRIKTIILTKNKTKNSVLTKIMMYGRDAIKTSFSNNSFKQELGNIILLQLQRKLKQEMNKIYPLSVFEIKKLEIMNR